MKAAKYFYTTFTLCCLLLVAGLSPAAAGEEETEDAPGRVMARQATKEKQLWITADHSKHEALKKTFVNGPEITKACLSCHSEAEEQFHKTIHWKWMVPGTEEGEQIGKAGYSLNNFCISTNKNVDNSCLACHPGWGTSTEAINCMVCHGQKTINWDEAFEDMQYFMSEGTEDEESKEIAEDLQTQIQSAVQAVGRPTRKNCGSCHFYGGGGDDIIFGDDGSVEDDAA